MDCHLNKNLELEQFLNAIIIGLMIDVCIKFVPTPENYIKSINFSYL